jgi:hypothetical protein
MLAHSMTNIQKYPKKDKSDMTEQQMLAVLINMYQSQVAVAQAMMYAISKFNQKDDELAWYALFSWCSYKDIRDAHWARFKHHYPDAMALKEGRSFDQY